MDAKSKQQIHQETLAYLDASVNSNYYRTYRDNPTVSKELAHRILAKRDWIMPGNWDDFLLVVKDALGTSEKTPPKRAR